LKRSKWRVPRAFRPFKRLLDEHKLWDSRNQFKQLELRQTAIEWCEENGITIRKT